MNTHTNTTCVGWFKNHLRASFLTAFAPLFVLTLASCATAPSGPNPSNPSTTNSLSVDEFYSPPPTGEADDYYMLMPGENDVQFSFFLDEQDYLESRGDADNNHDDKHFAHDEIKRGHGYGDYNHMHFHVKGNDDDHGVLAGIHFDDWTDSLHLTDSERRSIDTAMKQFVACSETAVDSFRVVLQPYRDSFKVQRLAIVAKLDSGTITRDSARKLLDSAIARYDTNTAKIRGLFALEIQGCLGELDAFLKVRLTPVQYAIWVRHRGW